MQTKKLTEEEQEKLNQQLFEAYDLSAIKAAVEAGADVNAKDKFGTPILQTAIDKDTKIIEYLLEAGADPDIQNNYGKTALHRAVSYNHINKVKLLLKYKADMYIKDNEGKTPFDISLLCRSYDIAELFLSAGYIPSKEGMQKVKNHRLFEAIEKNDLSAVKTAIADGADINAKNDDGNPLLLYTNITDIKIMRYLLENGMNPNTKANNRWSLLHSMSYMGTVDSIKILLEFGADMTVKEKWSGTPFGVAIHWGKYDIAELFVLNGYIPSDEDFNQIKDITEQEFLKARFTTLTVQMQEHKERLKEETKVTSQEFACADEVIEM